VTALRVWLSRLLGTLIGRRREDDLRDEIAEHLDLLADEYRRRGLSDTEARLAARRAFGGVEQTREAFRETRRLPVVDALTQDLRFAIRALRRDGGTTLAAIALLTVGVSSTVVLGDVIDRLLLRPPTHVDEPERVHRIFEAKASGGRATRMHWNYVGYERFAAAAAVDIEAFAPFFAERIGSGRGPDATRLEAIAFAPAYFDVLGLRPRLGVLPSARMPVDENAVVISHALWQQRFGGALDVVGRTLRLGQRTHTIVAVAPRGFAGIDDRPVDVWAPIAARDRVRDWRTSDGSFYMGGLVRLRPGADRTRVEARLSQVYNDLARERAERLRFDAPAAYRILLGALLPGQEPARSQQTTVILAVGAVSALVLLMACGNVGNLLILSGLRRSAELGLKAALGATRGRLIREVLVQALVLALAAGGGALAMVLTLGGLVRAVLLPPLAATAAPLDARLVLLTVAICAAAALVLGLVPAIRLSGTRVAAPGPGGRVTPPSRLIDTFVGLQVALAVPLLVGTGLFTVSFWKALHVDFGQQTDHVTVVTANFDDDGRPKEWHSAHRRMQAHVETLPGVTAVSIAHGTPSVSGFAADVEPDTGPRLNESAPMINGVDPSYFHVLGLRLVDGRFFTDAENQATAPPVAVVNEALAKRYWPGQSAVGRCLLVRESAPNPLCTEVVGVIAKAPWRTYLTGAADDDFVVLLPMERFAALNAQRLLLVRTTEPPSAVLTRLRQEAQNAAPLLPYVDAIPFAQAMESQYRPLRLGLWIFLGLSGLALVIAIAGLAVVTAHGVTRRTREMGIRLVLGAKPGDLVRLMARRTLIAMTLGLAVGGALAFAGARVLRSVLFGVEPGDPFVLAAAIAVLVVAGGLAAYVPARRTGRIDPSAALRID
jgi:predicted permease